MQRPRSGPALHIRNISRPVDSCDVNDVACRVEPSRMTTARRSILPPSAQTKVADQGSATRFDRCERFDAQWTLDMRSRFVGRRRRRDRATAPVFACIAPDWRCDTRSSCETFRRALQVRGACSVNRIRSQGGWFEYCCKGKDVKNRGLAKRGTSHDVTDQVQRDAGSTRIRVAWTARTGRRARSATPQRVDRVRVREAPPEYMLRATSRVIQREMAQRG